MALEDFFESEVAVAVAATAAALSPPVRKVLRRGAVYGLAGLLVARDALVAFGHGVSNGIQQSATGAPDAAHAPDTQADASAIADGDIGDAA